MRAFGCTWLQRPGSGGVGIAQDLRSRKEQRGLRYIADEPHQRHTEIVASRSAPFFAPVLRVRPSVSRATATTNAIAPAANTVSPTTRIQRSASITGVWRNSALRAYQ